MIFRKPKAHVKLYEDGADVHSKYLEHDLLMMTACALHLEQEGYDMSNVMKELSKIAEEINED